MTAQISAYAGWCPLLKSEPRISGTCMAMDHLYNAVAKHRKGDLVSVAGNMRSISGLVRMVPYSMATGASYGRPRRAHEHQAPATGYEGYDQTPPYDDGFDSV